MLLINPANGEYGGTMSRFTPLSLPMSIGCLAGQLRKMGHPVKVFDEELGRLDPRTLAEQVAGLPRPYLFGITVLTAQARRAYELARWLKSLYPDCIVVAGGFHVTALPEEALENGVDIVARGEGERTLPKLYEAILSGRKDFSGIEGLSFRADGEIVHTADAPLIRDLDTLPDFPYDLFQDLLSRTQTRRAYDWGFITTSRGCPYSCTYCSQRMITGMTYRYKSSRRIVHELDILINRLGAKNIFFDDDNFCYKRSRVKDVCEALIVSGLGQKCAFSLQTRADNFYPDIVPLLRKAGFTSVGFGMETGVDRLARLMHKGETVQQHVDAVRLAQAHGMDVALYLILGLPTETADDRAETARVVNSLKPTHVKYNNLIPYPGTPLYNDLKCSSRMNRLGAWVNSISALSEMGRPLISWRALPYVPETASEWELKRDLVRYNLLSSLRPQVLRGFLQRKHGPGWFKLESGWFLHWSDWYHLLRLAAVFVANLLTSLVPAVPFEMFFEAINRKLQKRVPAAHRSAALSTRWARESVRKALV